MGKVYQSVRGVVQGTLHRRKPATVISASANGDDTDLNGAVEELERIFADGIGKLKAAVSEDHAVITNKAQHAEQVIEGLKATISGLETKLKETEEAFHNNDLASQKMEATLTSEIRDLESLVKKKDEALESRDSEVNDLNSKRESLAEQVTQLELTIQQAKEEAASQAEQAIEGLKATITGLETKLKETEETLHSKDFASQKMAETLNTEIRDLESLVKKKDEALESRDSEVNDLKSKRESLAEQVTQLQLAIQQLKGEAASQTHYAERAIESLKAKIASLEAQRRQPEQIVGRMGWTNNGFEQDRDRQVMNINAELELQTDRTKKAGGVTSVITQPARKTVSKAAFDRLITDFSALTNIIGSIASLIVRDHVRALGESVEDFPQRRLTELLESLSRQIADDKLKAKFRERIY
jgi:chromosome segregation ATPase